MDLISFSVSGDFYCLPISEISEVLEDKSLLKIPRLPRLFDGLIQVHGRAISVLSFIRFLKRSVESQEWQIVVFSGKYEHFAMRIPGVLQTLFVPEELLQSHTEDTAMNELFLGGQKYFLLSSRKLFEYAIQRLINSDEDR